MGPKFVWKRIGLCFGLASWLVMGNLAEVSAQSDPAGFTTVINTPPMEFPSILSIRSNTQLNVFDDPDKRFEVDNGFFLGAFFSPITNVELNLFDGAINFDFIAGPGSTVNILGGRLGPSSQANSGSVVNISGGLVSNQFDANSGSEVNITGGVVGTAFNANAGSVVNLSGGTIGSQFDAFAGSVVNITGGNIGDRFDAMSGSDVTFYGGEFLLNGEVPSNPTSVTLSGDDVLTGTLEDGSVFVFSPVGSRASFSGVALQTTTLPANDLTPQIVNSEAGQTNGGLRAGQSLTLQDGGALSQNFSMVDATLDVQGGVVGENLQLVNSVANISGGLVGLGASVIDSGFNAYAGSTVIISGDAEIRGQSSANGDSEVNILGGTLIDFDANQGVVNVSGGSLRFLEVEEGSEAHVSGGNLERLSAEAGSTVDVTGGTLRLAALENSVVTISGGIFVGFSATTGSNVTMRGGEFLLNGTTPSNLAAVTVTGDDVLTGTLEDGSVFIFSDLRNGGELNGVTFETVPLPPNNLAPIVVDSATDIAPTGLRSGQSLTLSGDGVLGSNFDAVDATLNVEGGSVALTADVVSSTVNVSGGEFAESLIAYSGSEISFSGGEIVRDLNLFESNAEISGGALNVLVVGSNSVAEITGGTISSMGSYSNGLILRDGGIANISGGTIGGEYFVASDSELNFYVTEAFIDGVAIDDLMPDVSRNIVDRGEVVLSGVLADGSDFSILLNEFPTAIPRDLLEPGATVTVTLGSPEPDVLLGDCNQDDVVTFADISSFITVLMSGTFLAEADCNEDDVVNFSDIPPFIEILREL